MSLGEVIDYKELLGTLTRAGNNINCTSKNILMELSNFKLKLHRQS